jgi:hypothetical protein
MGQFSSTKLKNEIMSKSSLRDYITFYRYKGKQPYLEDMRDLALCLLKKSLIGSHPSSIRRAALDIFTFVFIMIFAARNCMLLNKSSFSLEDVSHQTNKYKHLGVYVTRTLKSNYHVQTYIKDNMNNKINFMSRILAEHGHLNCVEFGDALWS